jgi:LAS superfamily LD-carboxypeptidase LdcB
LTDEELTGQASTHISSVASLKCSLHPQAVTPFLNLRRAAAADGMDLEPLSGFRDFDRQLTIWNGKFCGERPMLDVDGVRLDTLALSPMERVEAILLWSALPGASRHHWGTDLDVADRNAVPGQYQIKLTREEFAPGGPFAPLDLWLEIHAPRFGFFRPFKGERSGVQPEPWHLSFAPTAEKARRLLSPAVLRTAIEGAPLQGKAAVLKRLEEFHARYVACIDLP